MSLVVLDTDVASASLRNRPTGWAQRLVADGGVPGGGLRVVADHHPVIDVGEPDLLDVHVVGDLPRWACTHIRSSTPETTD